MKLLRAEKTNTVYDDYKVFLVGLILALVILLVIPSFTNWWNYHVDNVKYNYSLVNKQDKQSRLNIKPKGLYYELRTMAPE